MDLYPLKKYPVKSYRPNISIEGLHNEALDMA